MAKKSNPRLTNSSTSGDASKMLEQRRNMTPEQRESKMNKVVNKVSGKKKSKGPLGSRKRLSGPRNKSQENRDRSRVIPPSESWPQGGNINAEGTFIPNDPIRVETTPNIKDSGYQTPNYESYNIDTSDDLTGDMGSVPPPTYKKSSCTYKLPGEGSRGAISKAGGFNTNSRAMQAGLIVDGGFGDLSSAYKGSSPAKIPLSPQLISAASKMASKASESGGGGGGGEKPKSREGRKVSSGYVENTNVADGVFDGNKLQ